MSGKLYKVRMPMIYLSDKKWTDKILKIRFILKEVFGYYDNEVDKLTEYPGDYLIAKNITVEQAIKIFKPIIDIRLDEFKFWLHDNETNTICGGNASNGISGLKKELGEIPCETPKEHYYDEPVVSRDQLYDPFGPYGSNMIGYANSSSVSSYSTPLPTQPSSSKPVVTCPYCQSTDTKKISTASKAASVAFWGIFSQKVKKQWHCNKCGSDF